MSYKPFSEDELARGRAMFLRIFGPDYGAELCEQLEQNDFNRQLMTRIAPEVWEQEVVDLKTMILCAIGIITAARHDDASATLLNTRRCAVCMRLAPSPFADGSRYWPDSTPRITTRMKPSSNALPWNSRSGGFTYRRGFRFSAFLGTRLVEPPAPARPHGTCQWKR